MASTVQIAMGVDEYKLDSLVIDLQIKHAQIAGNIDTAQSRKFTV